MSWNCNTFRHWSVLQFPLASCQISQQGHNLEHSLFQPQVSRRKPAKRLRWEEGQRSVARSRQSRERAERSLLSLYRAPITNQRSVCDGRRRDNGALLALGRAGSERSAVCFLFTGLPSQTSEAFAMGGGGTTERCSLSAEPGASGAQFVPTTGGCTGFDGGMEAGPAGGGA